MTKIGPKIVYCIFISYAYNNSAYRFLVHKSEIPNINVNKIIESGNASFFEHKFSCNFTQESRSLKRSYETMTNNS